MGAAIRQGTTPTMALEVDADITAHKVELTILGRGTPIELGNSRLGMTYDEGATTISFTLTQQETLGLHKGRAKVQIRAIRQGVAEATGEGEIEVLGLLKGGVISE